MYRDCLAEREIRKLNGDVRVPRGETKGFPAGANSVQVIRSETGSPVHGQRGEQDGIIGGLVNAPAKRQERGATSSTDSSWPFYLEALLQSGPPTKVVGKS